MHYMRLPQQREGKNNISKSCPILKIELYIFIQTINQLVS